MPRYRVAVDLKTDDPIPDYLFGQIGTNVATLANTAAVIEIDGVEPNLRVERVHSMHLHESTRDYLCMGCRELSMDQQNSNT